MPGPKSHLRLPFCPCTLSSGCHQWGVMAVAALMGRHLRHCAFSVASTRGVGRDRGRGEEGARRESAAEHSCAREETSQRLYADLVNRGEHSGALTAARARAAHPSASVRMLVVLLCARELLGRLWLLGRRSGAAAAAGLPRAHDGTGRRLWHKSLRSFAPSCTKSLRSRVHFAVAQESMPCRSGVDSDLGSARGRSLV